MSEFRSIEIDFDVHKLIEAERQSFSETPNDALRRLLRLPQRTHAKAPTKVTNNQRPWSGEGVTLPHGTRLRMRYNRRQHEGQVIDGKWVIDGKSFDTPSGAASGVAITKGGKRTRLDGWIYWEVMFPGDTNWTPIRGLRRNVIHVFGAATPDELGI